ncbi:Fe-S cluster assembly protein HesB [Phytoactinopolyspora halotolerans]|uniref:Fe-S cluster assembly protein HesB n=1 Tax=Phytoactinopolyspora halotolerans TaxID=1981512 RepID=A0A6L9S1G2_9ACTN|nr:Fe-S cluster assembly protein HesB [Phytoactinopolyspora halotolerans]NED99334.1 Fe-S cluster assembly protein HesB [Phytoactinopolyspora halotolerans]
MLVLTSNAVSAIRQLSQETAGAEHAGLRISSAADTNGTTDLMASISSGPEPHDEVVEIEGARVYLSPQAAPALEDMVLDAEPAGHGEVRFELMPQPS